MSGARLALLDADQHVALRGVEPGRDELDVHPGEDAQPVEVALDLQQLGVADRVAVVEVERAADDVALRCCGCRAR